MNIFKWIKKGSETPQEAPKPKTSIDGDYLYTYQEVEGKEPGWRVELREYRQEKDHFAPILDSIDDKPVNDISGLFKGCKNLAIAPKISTNTRYMKEAFEGCERLSRAPEIPACVMDFRSAFENCVNLKELPKFSGFPACMSNLPMIKNCFANTGITEKKTELQVIKIGELSDGSIAGELRVDSQEISFNYKKVDKDKTPDDLSLMFLTRDFWEVVQKQKGCSEKTATDMLTLYSRYDEIFEFMRDIIRDAKDAIRDHKFRQWSEMIPPGYSIVSLLADGRACMLQHDVTGQILILK